MHIGLVFHYNFSYSRGILRGIRQFLQMRPQWSPVHFDTDELSKHELKVMAPAGVIALIAHSHLARILRSLRRPVVNVAHVLPDLSFPQVFPDHGLSGRLAAAHLRERGFRHFGCVGHPRHMYSLEREAAFRTALEQDGRRLAVYHEQPSSYLHRGRFLVLNARFRQWLKELPKPIGIFACNDLWALSTLEACRMAGISVPEEVAVLGMDNDDLRCELARPSLSSIDVQPERIGFEAAALLDRLLQGAKPPQRPLLVPPVRVVTRQSTDIVAGSDPEVNAAVRFIRDHGHRPLSVDDVLREVLISRRSLERRFHALLERGIGEEIQRVHIERARNLLTTSSLPIDEVAEQAGFTSPNYMCRVFRAEMGLTPTAYRRQALIQH